MSKAHGHYYARASYKRARMRAMVRDNFTCRLCGCKHFFELTTHHLIPLDQGGENSAANLVTLCRACHISLEARLAQRRAEDEAADLVDQAASRAA